MFKTEQEKKCWEFEDIKFDEDDFDLDGKVARHHG